MSLTPHLRPPEPLKVTGSGVADSWERFKEQWQNYELAADLTEASSARRAAIFLTCVGGDAYDVFRSLPLSAEQKRDVDAIVAAFQTFCLGSINVTFERFIFNQRTQENNERFDVFLGEIRRLAKSCQFEGMEEQLIRDRIVVGIKDDATRRKLLQIRELTLDKAIDVCKASESAGQQLRTMTAQDQVQALHHTTSALMLPVEEGLMTAPVNHQSTVDLRRVTTHGTNCIPPPTLSDTAAEEQQMAKQRPSDFKR